MEVCCKVPVKNQPIKKPRNPGGGRDEYVSKLIRRQNTELKFAILIDRILRLCSCFIIFHRSSCRVTPETLRMTQGMCACMYMSPVQLVCRMSWPCSAGALCIGTFLYLCSFYAINHANGDNGTHFQLVQLVLTSAHLTRCQVK